MKNKLISFLLVAVLSFTFNVTANNANFLTVSAASEEFLSEVALVYEDSVEEARAAIAGTDWKLYEKDLNEKANPTIQHGVYLVYKTSTNVEDAITDLRVMDMYGGYSVSNYERQLEQSRNSYLAMVKDIRQVASEFKANYEAGDGMAELAYRQMNYYKDLGESDMLMGDFFLNIPSDEALVRILLEGNSNVTSNLISLLAISISGEGSKSLAEKVKAKYEIKDTLTDLDYYDKTVVLASSLQGVATKLARYDDLFPTFNFKDENLPEEEYNFLVEYGAVSLLLESIKLGEKSLADILRTGEWAEDYSILYPLTAAFSDGQMALIKTGAFETIIKYASPSNSLEKLNELLVEVEAKLEKDENGAIVPIDVYIGVDREIFKGAFAFTNAAERQQALTGKTWGMNSVHEKMAELYKVSAILAACDIVVWGVAAILQYNSVTGIAIYKIGETITQQWIMGKGFVSIAPYFQWNVAGVFFWAAVGIALIAAGIAGIGTWYNYYNPDYTEIPNTLIDVRETEYGDKYVKYSAAKIIGEEDGKNADFNAYEGKEWVALYYTKDATAGNCLTANFVYRKDNNTVSRRHQGINMFGETKAFNLNSHAYSASAPGIYLTVRYSTTKKAAADMPDVVGAMIAQGTYYAITALGGIGLGVGFMAIMQNRKLKKKDETVVTTDVPTAE